MSNRLIPTDGAGRRWLLMNLVNSIGDGLFLSGNAVFATRVIGLSGDQVGIGIAIGGVAGLIGAGALGTLADRFGARRMLLTLTVVQIALYLVYTTVSTLVPFVAVFALLAICKSGAYPAAAALVASIAEGDQRVRLRAQARSAYNAGFSIGAALAALVLTVDAAPAYYALPIGNALSFVLVWYVVRGLPEVPRVTTGPAKKPVLAALRDGPFLVTVGLTSVMSVHAALITVVVPLWIVERTTVPRPLIGVLLVLNTGIAITLQVAASRGAETLAGSAQKARWAGLAMAAGCAVLAPSGAVSTVAAVGLVLGAVLLLTAGELLQSAASWGMSYELAPPAAQAEYLGAFSMNMPAASIIGPALGTVLVLHQGAVGWLTVGLIVLVAAALVGPAATRAQASIARRFASTTV